MSSMIQRWSMVDSRVHSMLPFNAVEGRMKISKRAYCSSPDENDNISPQRHAVHLNKSSGHEGNSALSDEDTHSRKHVYSSLIAGVSSGAISSTICAPLDLVRTRIQVMGEIPHIQQEGRSFKDHIAVKMFQDIIQKDGLAGCFRGLNATLLTVPTFWGVYFSFYDYCKREWTRYFPQQTLSIVHLGSAITAGALSDVLCNPMFVVRTRLQTESLHHKISPIGESWTSSSKQTIQETVRALYAEGGIFTFWRGMTANLLGLSHVAVQFPAYEKLKVVFRGNKAEGNEKTAELLLASGISKISASILTYPHEVIRSRMMDIRSMHGVGFVETCRRVYAIEGVIGFYAGISVSLIRVIPNTMITFLVYERVLHLIRTRW